MNSRLDPSRPPQVADNPLGVFTSIAAGEGSSLQFACSTCAARFAAFEALLAHVATHRARQAEIDAALVGLRLLVGVSGLDPAGSYVQANGQGRAWSSPETLTAGS